VVLIVSTIDAKSKEGCDGKEIRQFVSALMTGAMLVFLGSEFFLWWNHSLMKKYFLNSVSWLNYFLEII
jgi:hypothetical protein